MQSVTDAWPWCEKWKATACLPAWLNFHSQGQFENQNFIVPVISTTYFLCIKRNWTSACNHLKTSNLSAGNFKKILDLDWLIPEPAIRSGDTGQWIPWLQHGCAISGCRPSNKLDSVKLNIWLACGANG